MGKAAPTAKINLDKERTLLMDANALEAVENETGKTMQQLGKNPSITDLKYLVWGCLLHEDEKLSPKAIGKHIHPNNTEYIAGVITKMLSKNG